MEAQAEQANEHSEKQDDVGGEYGDYVKFRGVDICYAGGKGRRPLSTDLGSE